MGLMETTRDDLLWGALTLEQPSEGQGPRVTVDTYECVKTFISVHLRIG